MSKVQITLPTGESYPIHLMLAKGHSTKATWPKCPACGKPAYWHQGCCDDPECEPHTFRLDLCFHCGFDQTCQTVEAYDVQTGLAEMDEFNRGFCTMEGEYLAELDPRMMALAQYAAAPE